MVIFHSYISLPEGNSGSMYNGPQMVGGMVDDRVYHMTQVIFPSGIVIHSISFVYFESCEMGRLGKWGTVILVYS